MKQWIGFTCIELLVTLSLVAIMLCFTLGLKQDFFVKNKVNLLEKTLINAIQYSRNKALMSGQDLALNAMDASQDWSSGMILLVDNPTHHVTKPEDVIYQWQWQQSPQLQLVWRGFKSNDYLIFSKVLRHSIVNGYFVILQDGIEVRRIVLNRLGRIRVV